MRDAEEVEASGGWSTQRIVFVSIASAVVLAVLVAVRSILLPFLLGMIIAYVLTPLVSLGERIRLPRGVSVVTVYLFVFGGLYISGASVAPRIYEESVQIARDLPAMLEGAAERHGPRIEQLVNDYLTKQRDESATPQHQPAALIQELPDGSLSVEVKNGFDIVEEAPGRLHLAPREEIPVGGVKVSDLVSQGIDQFIKYAQLNALHFLKLGQSLVAGLSRGVFLLFMTLMVAGYIIMTRENILSFFASLVPAARRPGFDVLIRRIDKGLSGVVRGQLLICVVNGVLSAIGFALFGLKYWPVLALVAGIMSIIPIFGSILSTIPAVLIGLTQDIWTALWVLLWIVGVHQVEANLLNPKIIGVSAKIHPVLVVFSLLVGEHFYGLWGALFAVPLLSLVQSIFNHFRFALPEAQRDSFFLTKRPPGVAFEVLAQRGGGAGSRQQSAPIPSVAVQDPDSSKPAADTPDSGPD
ncbi:MAG: AI-2E family transporter [Polyangiaceae bacterium]|nr:AI-2E family transporter [Polyangiaceae bacterium]